MSNFHERLMAAQQAWGEVADDFPAKFLVVSRKLEPALPFFVGIIRPGIYFISDEVPVEFRQAMIAHEHYCSTHKHREDGSIRAGHCLQAFRKELTRVGDADLPRYLQIRLMFLQALISYRGGDQPFVTEVTRVVDFIQSYLAGLAKKQR